jgi:cytoskeletal protein CcmA (bactofilin family)
MGIFGHDESTPEQKATRPAEKSVKVPKPASSSEPTLVARSTVLDGRISGSAEIIVNGTVKGTIDVSGTVTVAEHGRVEAAVHGRLVTVAGSVTGDITAKEKISLESSARIEGNLTAPRILINDGAAFKGKVNMQDSHSPPQVRTSSARKIQEESPKV